MTTFFVENDSFLAVSPAATALETVIALEVATASFEIGISSFEAAVISFEIGISALEIAVVPFETAETATLATFSKAFASLKSLATFPKSLATLSKLAVIPLKAFATRFETA